MREIHTRLTRLYPEVDIAHMPAEHMHAEHMRADPMPADQSLGSHSHAEHMCADPMPADESLGSHMHAEHVPPDQSPRLHVSGEVGCGGDEPSDKGTDEPHRGDGAAVEGLPGSIGVMNGVEGNSRDAANGQLEASQLLLRAAVTAPNGDRNAVPDCPPAAGDAYQATGVATGADNVTQEALPEAEPDQAVTCAHFVGNAPVHGDEYTWHIDADPASLPDCVWTAAFGDYVNGEPGQPLLVSLLLYLDDAWPRDWAAETLFLDAEVRHQLSKPAEHLLLAPWSTQETSTMGSAEHALWTWGSRHANFSCSGYHHLHEKSSVRCPLALSIPCFWASLVSCAPVW